LTITDFATLSSREEHTAG